MTQTTFDKTTQANVVAKIIAYEDGEMGLEEVKEFFQYLMDTGTIRSLQGHYQRMAQELLSRGMIVLPSSKNGE